ncbi:MAG: zinc ribbon domain-containing protein, partial [Armatimonadota bacterium]
MENCSNCGASVDDKAKICPHCGRPTRLNSPGMMSSGTLGCLIVGVLCVVVLAALLFPVFASARVAAKRTMVYSQCKDIMNAMSGYLSDNDDRYPPMKSSGAVEKLVD